MAVDLMAVHFPLYLTNASGRVGGVLAVRRRRTIDARRRTGSAQGWSVDPCRRDSPLIPFFWSLKVSATNDALVMSASDVVAAGSFPGPTKK